MTEDVIISYNSLSFSDRIVFYTTISNDISFADDRQSFLIETRFNGGDFCIYCNGRHVVKNGKRKVEPGKQTNQTFVSIPYDMISYKAQLAGIMVSVVKESYTSGTGYPDGEFPEKPSYNISRRIKRGVFKSNKGRLINADVNAAYQIIKAGGYKDFPIKERELVTRLNAA